MSGTIIDGEIGILYIIQNTCIESEHLSDCKKDLKFCLSYDLSREPYIMCGVLSHLLTVLVKLVMAVPDLSLIS